MSLDWMAELKKKAEAAQKYHAGPYVAVERSAAMGYPRNESSTLEIESNDGTTIAGTTIYRTRNVGFYFAAASPDRILKLIERVEDLEAQLSAPVEVKEGGEG